jgi:hypothetical protein
MNEDEVFMGAGIYFMLIKEFKCEICGKVCYGYLELEEHMEEHKAALDSRNANANHGVIKFAL